MRARLGLTLVLGGLLLGCATAPQADRARLHALWSAGTRGAALMEARSIVTRFAEANGHDLSALIQCARAQEERWGEEPLVPIDAASELDHDPLALPADHLQRGLRRALRHGEALVVIRAALNVGSLGLLRQAPGLMEVISSPEPLQLRKGLETHGDERDLRGPLHASLVTKAVALLALERLASKRP